MTRSPVPRAVGVPSGAFVVAIAAGGSHTLLLAGNPPLLTSGPRGWFSVERMCSHFGSSSEGDARLPVELFNRSELFFGPPGRCFPLIVRCIVNDSRSLSGGDVCRWRDHRCEVAQRLRSTFPPSSPHWRIISNLEGHCISIKASQLEFPTHQ